MTFHLLLGIFYNAKIIIKKYLQTGIYSFWYSEQFDGIKCLQLVYGVEQRYALSLGIISYIQSEDILLHHIILRGKKHILMRFLNNFQSKGNIHFCVRIFSR